MKRRDVLKWGLAAGLSLPIFETEAAEAVKSLPVATCDKLPRWRGFNLLEKFNGRNTPFVEDDFRWISDLGFDFVRLPMDYRMLIKDKDWRKFDEKVLDEIDDAVRYGEKYGIHVNMNFHRAPGYTVAQPPEAKSLWTDPEAREVCALHWGTFAKRYKGVSNDRLSFNLFNEPGFAADLRDQCVAAHKIVIAAIRKEDPDRLIICDGCEWGTKPFTELIDQKVAQATRGYAPGEISHYKASWVDSKDYPEPSWPTVSGNGWFCSPGKGGIKDEFKRPMKIDGAFPSATKIRLLVGTVSSNTSLIVEADGEVVFQHDFKPGPGEGEWKESVHKKEWNVYQNIYDKNYEATIPAGTKEVKVRAGSGDWLTVKEFSLTGDKGETTIRLTSGWNKEPSTFRYDGSRLVGGEVKDRDWLKKNYVDPWTAVQKQGVGVMVGEFGSFNFTPHDIVLRWMEDMLANWKEVGWGYAMWNFRGSFGILDSGRKDVEYEDFHGHKLDRKMLELLKKYA